MLKFTHVTQLHGKCTLYCITPLKKCAYACTKMLRMFLFLTKLYQLYRRKYYRMAYCEIRIWKKVDGSGRGRFQHTYCTNKWLEEQDNNLKNLTQHSPIQVQTGRYRIPTKLRWKHCVKLAVLRSEVLTAMTMKVKIFSGVSPSIWQTGINVSQYLSPVFRTVL